MDSQPVGSIMGESTDQYMRGTLADVTQQIRLASGTNAQSVRDFFSTNTSGLVNQRAHGNHDSQQRSQENAGAMN